jgi:hypothetical protein
VEAAMNRATARNVIWRIDIHFLRWGEQYMQGRGSVKAGE